MLTHKEKEAANRVSVQLLGDEYVIRGADAAEHLAMVCLLYTSPSPRDRS